MTTFLLTYVFGINFGLRCLTGPKIPIGNQTGAYWDQLADNNVLFQTVIEILYQKLHEAILKAEPKAKVEYKKLYIAYKLKTNFVDIVVQKSRLRLSVNLDFDEVHCES